MQRVWSLVLSSAAAGLLLCGCNKTPSFLPSSSSSTAAPTYKWGYIDKTDRFVINPQFDEASNFNKDGAAFVKDGKRIIRLQANPPKESSDPVHPEDSSVLSAGTVYRAANGEGDTYKVMQDEKCVYDPVKDKAKPPEEVFQGNDYVCVIFGKKSAFLDKSGKVFLSPFDSARNYSEGRAAVQDGKKWGFITKKGRFVIPPKYMAAGDFVNGLAPVAIPADTPK